MIRGFERTPRTKADGLAGAVTADAAKAVGELLVQERTGGFQAWCIVAIHRDLLVSEIEFLGAASDDAGHQLMQHRCQSRSKFSE
jgi:hypothetical protein